MEEEGLGLLGGEAGEVGPRAADERPPTAPPSLRVDGHAGESQSLEVATCRGDGDLHLHGDLRRGDPSTGLQQQQGGHEAIGAHLRIFSRKVLRR